MHWGLPLSDGVLQEKSVTWSALITLPFITMCKCLTYPPWNTVAWTCALCAYRILSVHCRVLCAQGQERWFSSFSSSWTAKHTHSSDGSASVWASLSDISFMCQYGKLEYLKCSNKSSSLIPLRGNKKNLLWQSYCSHNMSWVLPTWMWHWAIA